MNFKLVPMTTIVYRSSTMSANTSQPRSCMLFLALTSQPNTSLGSGLYQYVQDITLDQKNKSRYHKLQEHTKHSEHPTLVYTMAMYKCRIPLHCFFSICVRAVTCHTSRILVRSTTFTMQTILTQQSYITKHSAFSYIVKQFIANYSMFNICYYLYC